MDVVIKRRGNTLPPLGMNLKILKQMQSISNKRNLFVVICLLAITTVWAEPISESRARQIAAQFMANHSMPSTTFRKARKAPMAGTESSEKAAYYVFNANEGGYVIVAGDDRAPAVLGYSENGIFDDQDMPEAMQSMLDGYVAQIAALEQGVKAAPQLTSGNAITPLVQTEWSQGNPFNLLLPTLSSGKRAVVGCVATALSQVMNYWQWPERPTCPLPAYTTSSLNINMPELPVADFRWDLMKNNYETDDTGSEGAMAAAMLSQYCAQAVKMDFHDGSSGAPTSSVPNFAAAYFDYDPGAHMESRENYSTQGWADLIYGELSAGRPVIYSGSKKDGGHAFICDGFDGNGMFHINWGWNGQSNGYFVLNVLNPDEQGTGSASGAYGYIMGQGVIVGFQPNKGGINNIELTASNVTLNSYTDTRSATNEAFTFRVTGAFFNYTSDTLAVRMGFGLFKDDGMIKRLYSGYHDALRPAYYITQSDKELKLGEGITSGTYRIMPMCCEMGKSDWRPCAGADRNYIEVTINGNECTATCHGSAGTPNYTINNIAVTGNMHNNRPVNMDVNMTNNGHSSNRLLYMFVDGQFAAAGYVGLESGETGNIHYSYLFEDAGNYTLTWSWNEDGSNPVSTRNITINPMPAANLSATIQILNVTDSEGKVITSDKFSIVLTITNKGNTTYDEDISAKLCKHTKESYGTGVQEISKHLTLAPGKTTTMQFDMTDVTHNWQYFIKTYFYSEGEQKSLKGTTTYTIKTKPSANLTANVEVLDVAEDGNGNKFISSEKFSVALTILNNDGKAYDNDIMAILYEDNGSSNGKEMQRVVQHLTLGAGQRTTMQFDMTDVVDGHTYRVCSYFYSEGERKLLADACTSFLPVVFPKMLHGDVNGDGILDVADVTALVDIILNVGTTSYNLKAADVDKNEKITVADVTALVDLILGRTE